ncbi:hypothetical protein Ait01nite_032080 [Actinoplanes italicus]|uniref:Scaffolding protein n=1 Tax=Actinoplanes italicus TaxID=113567 RepID=A0A2T0KJF6_9ACTN|nr:hypothetical protein [Actinoplanes italicus]PRX23661.1 hypothetical protein CLV67_103410 [Actinoplanes italicus]GIE30163.1 hypothetical protein Ait01nite_032080 [Actinoplanes italicus]
MADDTTLDDDTATGADQDSTAPAAEPADDLGDAGRRALTEERRARKVAERELANLRKAAMSDQERAVAEAKAAGLAEAARAAAPRLVRAEFRAAAAGQIDRQALDAYLEDVDLTKFVTDEGEPDLKAIEARIKRLGGGKPADFDGGARTPAASPTDMNSLIRRAAGLS